MKKTALPLLIILVLGIATVARAQTPDTCNPIDQGNYQSCCVGTVADNTIGFRCDQYENSGQYCADFPIDPACQTVSGQIPPPNGGTPPPTGPINGGTTGTTIDSSFTPQSGATALNSCKIKIRSAIDILIWLKCIIVVAIIPLIFALAFLFFLWGVFKFMMASDAKSKQEGQKLIWWGLIGLFVMVSVWGIIKIVGDTLGIDSKFVPTLQTTYLK